MSPTSVEAIADAVLYEGYLLYPYRPTALKNRYPGPFGTLYPRSNDPSVRWTMRVECLAQAAAETMLSVRVRFLHRGAPREVLLAGLVAALCVQQERAAFRFAADPGTLDGVVHLSAQPLAEGLFQASLVVENLSSLPPEVEHDGVLLHSLASTHAILELRGGQFVSLTDPPAELRILTDQCRNDGVWPVLVGARDERHTLLAAPIILPDYPQLALESPGNLFDATEIDELLSLRILTLTPEEKIAMAVADP